MKKSKIELGKQYSNDNGTIRLVVGVGPYKLYDEQEDTDCVRYKLIAKRLGPHPVGSEQNCTRRSFATWAKREV